MYDSIIIGAGPAGLTFATLAADENEKILIIEKNSSIGGCHNVNRQQFENEMYFCEHGPRVYFNNYLNFRTILKKMNLDFYKLFKKFNLSLFETLINEMDSFNFREVLIFTKDYFKLFFNPNYALNLSMSDYMINNKFSEKAINRIDRSCRFMDGGDSTKISLNIFFNVINECLLYNIYQPKKPNDEGLFLYWYNYLKSKKVDFKLKSGVKKIVENDEYIKIETENGEIIQTKKLIIAIPPENLIKILKNSPDTIKNSFGNFEALSDYSSKTEYGEYISITFHWAFDLNLDAKIYGMGANTDWGLGAIVLSDYMNFKEKSSKTVISTVITITDKKSKNINKTANECKTKKELIDEVYRQLKEIYKNLPYPTLTFINNKYQDGKWKSDETAFIKVPNYNYLNFSNNKNIYTLGTHNGQATVHFTVLESAVTNAISLINLIYKKDYKIKKPYNLKELILIIIILIMILFLFMIKYYI
jgi:hypothetical protein